MSQDEANAVEPNVIDLYTAREGDTWQSIAQRAGKGLVSANTLAIMNDHAIDQQPKPGTRLKIRAGGILTTDDFHISAQKRLPKIAADNPRPVGSNPRHPAKFDPRVAPSDILGRHFGLEDGPLRLWLITWRHSFPPVEFASAIHHALC